jgi:hypothetical protein
MAALHAKEENALFHAVAFSLRIRDVDMLVDSSFETRWMKDLSLVLSFSDDSSSVGSRTISCLHPSTQLCIVIVIVSVSVSVSVSS